MRASCVICSDFLDEINPISAAPCGHVYHSVCLSRWIDQSRTCPQCRAPISKKANIQRLYFNFPPLSVTNTSELENEVINLKTQLSAKNIELQKCMKDKEATVVFVRAAEERASELQQIVYQNQSEITELKLRAKSVAKMEAKLLKLEKMNLALMNDLEHLNHVQMIVQGTQKDVEQILEGYDDSKSSKQLATYCTCLKRELQKVIESKDKLTQMNAKLKNENALFVAKVKHYEEALSLTTDKTNLSSQKKPRSFNFEFNNSAASTPTTSTHSKPADDTAVDISPLTVQFNKPNKFNMCIKSSSNIKYSTTSSAPSSNPKVLSVQTVSMNNNENDSIIRSGYNGLGGHSKFINSQFKRIKPLKRKA